MQTKVYLRYLHTTLLVYLLSGCTGDVPYSEKVVYLKKGASQDDLEIAEAKCRMGQRMLPSLRNKTETNVSITTVQPTTYASGNDAQQLGKAVSRFGETMSDISSDLANERAYFEDCMISQGFKKQTYGLREGDFVFTQVEGEEVQYKIEPVANGFEITLRKSRYQFIPDSKALGSKCESAIASIAQGFANKKRKKISPVESKNVSIKFDRDEVLGMTRCQAFANIRWK